MLKLNKVFVAEGLKVDENLGTEEITLEIEEIESTETIETVTVDGKKTEITRIHKHGKMFPVYVKESTMEIVQMMF